MLFLKSTTTFIVTFSTKFSPCTKRYFGGGSRTLVQTCYDAGYLEPAKQIGHYEPGQLFIHKIFGYRGVVLHSWLTELFDRDRQKSTNGNSGNASPKSGSKRGVKGIPILYYQVLVDSRDEPHIRALTNSITFLAPSETSGQSLYPLSGFDHVSHEDIIPYRPPATDDSPMDEEPVIRHELFENLFDHCPSPAAGQPQFKARDMLTLWTKRNQFSFDTTRLYRETTQGVRVSVMPFYLGCKVNQGSQDDVYWWRYCVRMELMPPLAVTPSSRNSNTKDDLDTDRLVQLRDRHWRVFSSSGVLETIQGRGVVGTEPILSPTQPAFQYTSQVSLPSSSGHMWGTFKMERCLEDGTFFNVRVPSFSLESASGSTITPKSPSSTPPPTIQTE